MIRQTAIWKTLSRIKHEVRRSMPQTMDWMLTPFMPLLGRLISYMAYSGAGTKACLKYKCLPMPVHYYSPIPDIEDSERRKVWEKKSSLPGIEFDKEKQIALLRDLGGKYGDECLWPLHPTQNPHDFFVDNDGFSYGCAAITYSLIRESKPRKIIEIGSGLSSRVISQALINNAKEGKYEQALYTIIDPYPSKSTKTLPGLSNILVEPVETTSLEIFESLGENDILFIDSSHMSKLGSDVNFLFLEVLPRLKPGVLVHIHDIALPYEYTKHYATMFGFRMFWNEAYLLQAFLCFNQAYEVLLGMNYLMLDHSSEFRDSFVHYQPDIHNLTSHSFWIRRKPNA